MTVNFVNCILYYCTFITFEGLDISSVTYFYLLLPGPPLYIIGNTNSNTMTLDELSGIQSNCLPPPPPPCNPPPDPPNLWSRATLSCIDYDYEQLAMRRKAEVLKYKGNQNPLTKKQQLSRNVNGNGPLGKKVWATQNDLGSNPNVFNLPQVGNTLILCSDNNTNNIKCEPSSSSDVPGNSVLCYNPAVPLVNYLPPPRTYLAGGTKWPQSTWKPGDNGFPRGKKGSMNMLFQ